MSQKLSSIINPSLITQKYNTCRKKTMLNYFLKEQVVLKVNEI